MPTHIVGIGWDEDGWVLVGVVGWVGDCWWELLMSWIGRGRTLLAFC